MRRRRRRGRNAVFAGMWLGVAFVVAVSSANAQLLDVTQAGVEVPGGTIAKSLEEQMGAGPSNPQDPAEHGSISLAPLFQIEDEGSE